MPVNGAGSHINVSDYDRADGFSPGSALIVHVRGLDLGKTGAVGLTNMSKSFAQEAPIVVIDEQTGARQLIWAELDANADGRAEHQPDDPSWQELHLRATRMSSRCVTCGTPAAG